MKRIFITLGSQKFQFNRLLKAVDELCENKEEKEREIFAQIGYSTYKPKHFEYHDMAREGQCDRKLVMASHSNYIFNELNNRVLAGELGKSTYSPILMKCENEESNTYYMDMDEFGVSDSNFADASEILCDEREELIIKLMEKMENENN